MLTLPSSFCSHNALLSNVTVEVREGGIVPAKSLYDKARGILQMGPGGAQSFEDTYKQTPNLGVSIGVDGLHGTGTLGAWIKVTFRDGSIGKFFCTNHHCISRTSFPLS